jgi:sugar lactone lactonase YvrE
VRSAAFTRALSASAALAATLILAACAGGARVSPPSPGTPAAHTASITFVVKIPSATSSTARVPRYVSPSSAIIKASVIPAGGGTPATAQNACSTGQCTVTIAAPIGTDTFTISLYDTQNNLLSTGSTSQTVVEGQTNTVTVVFGGVIATVQLTPSTFGVVKGSPSTTTVAVNALDADGNVIVAPPAAYTTPIALSVNDPTNSVTLSATTVTMPGTSVIVHYNGSNAVPAAVTITASASGATAATVTITTTASAYLYGFGGTLDRYPVGGGTIGPLTRIESCPRGTITAPPLTVGIDGTLYVANSVCGPNVVETFARGSATKTVFTLAEGGYGPGAVDGANHLYISGGIGVSVFAPPYPDGSTATAIRRLANVVNAIALDSTGALYGVANAGSLTKIDVFAPNATGIAAPARTLNPPGGASFYQLALDPSNNLYVTGSLNGAPAIFVYAPGASGNAIPARVITGSATQLAATAWVAADAAGYVYATGVNSVIAVFAPNANGNVAPLATTPPAMSGFAVTVDNVGSPTPPPPAGNPAPVAHVTQYALTGSPGRITAGPDTAIWLTDDHGIVQRIGATNDPGGPGGVTSFNVPGDPVDITTGSDGALWVLEHFANTVVRLTTTGTSTQYPLPVANLNAQLIGRGGDGNVWLSTATPPGIGRVTPAGVITLFPLPANERPSSSFVGASDGNTYTVLHNGTGGGDVTRIAPNGTVTVVATLPAPGPICVGPDGNLWVAFGVPESPPAMFPSRAQAARIPLAGGSPALFPLFATRSTQSASAGGIAPGPNGQIYVSANTAISAITTAGADVFDTPNINGVGNAVGELVQGPDGNVWFIDNIIVIAPSSNGFVLKVLTIP